MHLVDHDVRIGQREPLAFGPGAQQHRRHARRHAKAIGRHITRQKLHGVINGQPCRHRTAWRIDVNIDILFAVLHLQEKQLRDN